MKRSETFRLKRAGSKCWYTWGISAEKRPIYSELDYVFQCIEERITARCDRTGAECVKIVITYVEPKKGDKKP